MEAFYTVNTPDDPVAAALTRLWRQEYTIMCDNLPPLNADIDDAVTAMAAWSRRSPYHLRQIVFALHRLDELPQLKQLQAELCHLDFPRLIAIDRVMDKLGAAIADDALERIDTALTRYLTPRRARQTLPSVANIRRKLNQLIAVEDPLVGEASKKKEEQPAPPLYDITPLSYKRHAINTEYDSSDASLMHTAISQCAAKHDISLAEALKLIVLGELSPPEVVLHVYRAGDIPDAPAYIAGLGWVDAETADKLTRDADRTVDLDEHATRVSPLYATPETIKRVVEGRDGTCRYPRCNRPAETCQKDHCVDYAAGGPTAAFNLVSLCQHHHNIKTDGRATYIIDPATDDVVWLFEDGTWQRTEATGPSSVKNRNWVQTISQAMTACRTRTRDDLMDALTEHETQEKPAPAKEDEPENIPF